MATTYVMVKPGFSLQIPKIVALIEKNGGKIIRSSWLTLSIPAVEEHYAHIKKNYPEVFPTLLDYMSKHGECFGMIVYGDENIISTVREQVVKPIRQDKTIVQDKTRNVIHASDSAESANAEIKRFFDPKESKKLNIIRRATTKLSDIMYNPTEQDKKSAISQARKTKEIDLMYCHTTKSFAIYLEKKYSDFVAIPMSINEILIKLSKCDDQCIKDIRNFEKECKDSKFDKEAIIKIKTLKLEEDKEK